MTRKAYITPTTLTMPLHQGADLLSGSGISIDTDKTEKGDAWEEAASKENQTDTDDLWDE